MNKVILKQKRTGVIPQGPYGVYVDGKHVGSVGRYSPLSFDVDSEQFNLTLKYYSIFSSSMNCTVSKDITIIEYEPIDVWLLLFAVIWDIVAVLALLFHFRAFPYYVWLFGIFGIPIISFIWQLIKRNHYFKIKVVH